MSTGSDSGDPTMIHSKPTDHSAVSVPLLSGQDGHRSIPINGTDDEAATDSKADQPERRHWCCSRNVVVLLIAFTCSTLFATGQVIVGIIGNSLALLADSVHMYTDSVTYLVNIYAEYVKAQAELITDPKMRAAHLLRSEKIGLYAASVSLVAMVVVASILLSEAIRRLMHLDEVKEEDEPDATLMLILGLCGILFDCVSLTGFACCTDGGADHGHSHSVAHSHSAASLPPREEEELHRKERTCAEAVDMLDSANMCSALMHVLGDLLRSITLVVGAAVALSGKGNPTKVDALCLVSVIAIIFLFSGAILNQIIQGCCNMTPPPSASGIGKEK